MKKLLYLCCIAALLIACNKDDESVSTNEQEGDIPWFYLYHDSVPSFYDFVFGGPTHTLVTLHELDNAHPSLEDLLAVSEYVEEQRTVFRLHFIFQCVDSCGKICYFPKHYEVQDKNNHVYLYYHPWQFAWNMDVDPYEILNFKFRGDSIFQYGYYLQGHAFDIVDSRYCGYKYDEATCTLEFEHPVKFELMPEVTKIQVRYIDVKHHYLVFDISERIEGAPDNTYTRMVIGGLGTVDFN